MALSIMAIVAIVIAVIMVILIGLFLFRRRHRRSRRVGDPNDYSLLPEKPGVLKRPPPPLLGSPGMTPVLPEDGPIRSAVDSMTLSHKQINKARRKAGKKQTRSNRLQSDLLPGGVEDELPNQPWSPPARLPRRGSYVPPTVEGAETGTPLRDANYDNYGR